MKCRCPYCKTIADWHEQHRCPSCGKAALPPSFFAKSETKVKAPARERRGAHSGGVWWLQGGNPASALRLRLPFPRATLTLAAVAIVGAILLPARTPINTPEVVNSGRDNLHTLRLALLALRQDCGRYPTTTEGLAALLRNPGLAGWQGPYLLDAKIKPDPWGRPFAYASGDGVDYALSSHGADGRPGTEDDLVPPPHTVIIEAQPVSAPVMVMPPGITPPEE